LKDTVAIIPARGGSKRIPKKNILDFDGKPMLAWTIEAAKQSELFEAIVVSTDSEEIAEQALKYGAEVPGLRESAADDMSPVSEATLASLIQMEKQGRSFETVVQLFAVCPLRTAHDIQLAYDAFQEKKVDFLISCYKYVAMNPWWAVQLDPQGKASWVFKDSMKRSQDLPHLFCPTGATWIANVEALKRDKSFYGEGHIFWEMDWKRAIDIDTMDDVEMALALKAMAAKKH